MNGPEGAGRLAGLTLILVSAIAPVAAAQVCEAIGSARNLPDIVRESSGLAASRERPGLLWTHNDRGNEAEIFAFDAQGRHRQTVRLAEPATDWEDLGIGSCAGATCLYVGDIGDNDALREHITVYRLPEPADGVRHARDVDALRARYPDGPRDAEALFVLPPGDIFVVTKGRNSAITLYRFPPAAADDGIGTLERLREIAPQPEDNDDRVSAAAASPDGRFVGIRSYRRLYLYEAEPLVGGEPVDPAVIDLVPLGEGQGEGLALTDDGTVWLSSEAANRRSLPTLNRLQCAF